MVKGNTIIKKDEEQITEDDQQEIEAILRYFKNNHQFEDIVYLPDNFTADDTEDYFGFQYKERYNNNKFQYFSYNLNVNKNNQMISVKDYDYLFHISNIHEGVSKSKNGLTVKMNNLNKEIIINQDDKEIYRRSLIPILVELHQQNKDIPAEKLNPEEFIYIDQSQDIKVKYIFNSFYGNAERESPDNINIRSVDFYLLIKP
jgi:hypothetical protein